MSDYSYEFFKAFSGGIGSYLEKCQCGRTYFASRGGCLEGSELEEFLVKSKEEPNKYIDTGDDGILLTDLGAIYVHGCICGAEKRYEDWIWSHRRAILQYIKSRSAQELKIAQEQMDSCSTI